MRQRQGWRGLFAEHIDCCTYRLDAWKTGITAARLEEMRASGGEQGNTGIYLGAFAWLEDLRPNKAAPAPVALDAELAAVFQRANEAPLKHDPANAGYIHAPSLNHAATAAILKNAYRVNASPANPDAMAVNLSSDRVRRAMDILEGIRNGQTLRRSWATALSAACTMTTLWPRWTNSFIRCARRFRLLPRN